MSPASGSKLLNYRLGEESFLHMKNKSPKGKLMKGFNTPFGNICIKLDGKEIDFFLNSIDKDDVLYPDINGAYRIIVTMEQDWKKHDLKIELQDSGTVGEAERIHHQVHSVHRS